MNTERLLKLADHLEQTVSKEPDTFDMTVYGERVGCGTKCCALGHACSIPEFREGGLRLEWFEDDPVADVRLERVDGQEDLLNIDAAMSFFGLEEHQAVQLFTYRDGGGGGPKLTPHDVANEIRTLVKRHLAGSTPKGFL
jgi:hypothetical protein